MQLSGGVPVDLNPETFWSLLGRSDVRFRLRLQDRDGRIGSLEVLASQIVLDVGRKSDPVVAEIAFIATRADAVTYDRDQDRTILNCSASLKHCYERTTVRLNASVAPATHGETVNEIVGSGVRKVARRTLPPEPVAADLSKRCHSQRACVDLC